MRKLLLGVLALILLLPATPALAQGHGGGGRGGGGRGGSHGGSWHGGRHGGFHGGFRGGGVYVSPYWGWGWGWGWAPYYYGAYYYGPRYGYGGYGPATDWAVVDTDVSPEETRVYLDGRYIGVADDFDGFPDYLYLRPGHYKLELRLEGFEPQTLDVDARPGVKISLNNKLRKIPGAKQYGSYETPPAEGGVLRYWGKQRGAAQPYDGEGQRPYRDTDVQAEPDRDREEEAAPPPPRGSGSPGVRDDSWRQGTPEARPRQRARLLLTVRPGDAAVYLDDRFLGIAQEIAADEKGVALAPGRHTIMVSRPGFKDRTLEVEISAGESKTVEVSLNR